MIKKTTAYIFVFVATFILLAHAVVPHCHLDDRVVFISGHPFELNSGHDHQHHQHQDCDHADSCVLKQIFSVPANQTKITSGNNFAPISVDFMSVSFENDFRFIISSEIIIQTKHDRQTDYTTLTHTVTGLRAPPARMI